MMPFLIQKLCKQSVRMRLAPVTRPEGPLLSRPRLWGPHSTRYRLLRAFDALPQAARFACIRPFESAVCHEQATARRMDRDSFAGGRWKRMNGESKRREFRSYHPA